MPITKDINLTDLASKTDGYSGADIEAVCREAAMLALRDNIDIKTVKKQYFVKALSTIKPSLRKADAEKYAAALAAAKTPTAANVPSYMG